MSDDAERLRALADYRVLDTPLEEPFENIVRAAARIFGAPIALVSLVDEDRQWFKARYGFDLTETPRDWSFCTHAIAADKTLTIPDLSSDARFEKNPLVVAEPLARFYCGVPLHSPEGHALGTLCVLDRKPRTPSADDVAVLELLARQVELEMEIRRRLLLVQERLSVSHERQTQNELLAAMIVHDLRNPLAAVAMLASTIKPLDKESRQDLDDLLSEAERMRCMLTDVLDICLHESGGLRLRKSTFRLGALVSVIARRRPPGAQGRPSSIEIDLPTDDPAVEADPELVRRIIENLVGNAVQHSGAPSVITLAVRVAGGRVVCEVRDRNRSIPAAEREHIFDALAQGVTLHRGYGLGLTFCRLAVQAHGGSIAVESNADGTGNCFRFDLPRPSTDAPA